VTALDAPALAALGEALRAQGLHARALALWMGTATLARLPAVLARAAPNPSRAAWILELLIAGRPAPRADARARLGDALDALDALGIIEQRGDQVRARRAVVPVAAAAGGLEALAVCDRWDAAPSRDSTPWPDDSSHHLCGAVAALTPRRWLDLGTGSGLAPLTCARRAELILGGELVRPTARCAALGGALSARAVYRVAVMDLDDAVAGRWDLVSCNAPLPEQLALQDASAPRWRFAAADFVTRLCRSLPARVTDDGCAVIHARHDALARALAGLGGDAVSVVYTPVDVTAFSVTWWRPHLPARRLTARRLLTPARPHLETRDREDAVNNLLPSLPELGAS
jgi:hypothetical protein